MNSYIIGTAGHVDHGKTRLIKALTGVDTDRLKEERERGISIELGFASLPLPSGATAGVVDVPGHEKFVRQMLAGIGGIDLVLLIIAADEGVMPQTKEHLEIIDLLKVQRGLIVLTKVDLVEPDWCELVKLEIAESVNNTVLEQAEIIGVSAVSGLGLDYLRKRIDEELEKLAGKPNQGPCRLPVDRTFTVPGFGTVVTGTMYHGQLQVGDSVVIEPGNLVSRVRSMQVHGNKVEQAYAGQRVAVNLPNVELTDIPKGATLMSPDYLKPTQTLDLSLMYLESAPGPLVHRQRVRFHIGTKEVLGRIHLLDSDELEPGRSTYAQILLEEPVVAARKDKFIIRQYSPTRTIAGGTILDAGNKKYKRYSTESIKQLAIKEKGTPDDLVYEQLGKSPMPQSITELSKVSGLSFDEVKFGLEKLDRKVEQLVIDGQTYWLSKEAYSPLVRELIRLIKQYHETYTLRPGILKEEVKSRLFAGWNNKCFTAILKHLQDTGVIESSGNHLNLPGFVPEPNGELKATAAKILQEFEHAKFCPPDWEAILEKYAINHSLHEELLQFYLRNGVLVKVANNMYFSNGALAEAKALIIKLLAEKTEFTTSEAKDVLNTSRKFLIPLLEYLDSQKVTRRAGEKRVKF